jgi:hypothetical protein
MSNQMTISQALRRIAKLKGQVSEYRNRAYASVSYKAGAKPAFDFQEYISKTAIAQTELLDLQTKIAIANAKTTLVFKDNSITLTEAILTLQRMKGDMVWLKSLSVRPQAETEEKERDFDDNTQRYIMTQVKWVCSLPESERADAVEIIQKGFDDLNDAVERLNHITQVG